MSGLQVPQLPTFLIEALNKYGGFIPRWITSCIIAGIAALALRFGLEMSADSVALWSGLISAAVAGAWGEFLKAQNERGVKIIQDTLQPVAPEVLVDGKPLAVTVAAVQRTVAQASTAASTMNDIAAAAGGGTQPLKP